LDNLVRSGTKQPNPVSASAGGLAHPPFPLIPLNASREIFLFLGLIANLSTYRPKSTVSIFSG